jgi:hypothetical protein
VKLVGSYRRRLTVEMLKHAYIIDCDLGGVRIQGLHDLASIDKNLFAKRKAADSPAGGTANKVLVCSASRTIRAFYSRTACAWWWSDTRG